MTPRAGVRHHTDRTKGILAVELSQAVAHFIASRKLAGRSTCTIAMYSMWFGRLKTPDLEGVGPALEAVIADLRARNRSDYTVRQFVECCRIFLKWCVAKGYIGRNPMDGFRIAMPHDLPQVPPAADLRAVIAACRCPRDRAALLVMADTGVKRGELLALTVDRYDPVERSLFVYRGKGRKSRVVYVSGATAAALAEHLDAARLAGPDRIFPFTPRGLTDVIHTACERAGLPRHRRIRLHQLRHFAITSWLRAGVGVEHARRLSGHADLSQLQQYSALVAEDLKAAHAQAGALEKALAGD